MCKKIMSLTMAIAMFTLANTSAFEEQVEKQVEPNSPILNESIISEKVKSIVKDKGDFSEPILVESDIVNSNGSNVFFYITPPTYDQNAFNGSLSDIRPFGITPINETKIKQGSTIIFSKHDGEPWTVTTKTIVILRFTTNQSGPTSMRFGHLNAETNEEITNFTADKYHGFSGYAQATKIRFYIQNVSSSDVTVKGSIEF